MKTKNCYWFLIGFLAVIAIASNSCYTDKEVTDPESNTPGYKMFTGKKSGFRISFEYPNSWSRVTLGRVGTYYYMPLLPPDCSVIIDSDVNKRKGGDYANASELIQFKLELKSIRPDFIILSRTNIQIGPGEGEEVIYSYVFGGQDPHMPIVYADAGEKVIARTLDIDYKDRIYDIDLLASADKYEEVKIGFEHLLATFRFLK